MVRSRKVNFKVENFLTKNIPKQFVQFCHRIQKMSFIFTYNNCKCQNTFKMTPLSLPVLPFTAKNIDNALKFCTFVVCVQLYNIKSCFFGQFQNFGFNGH